MDVARLSVNMRQAQLGQQVSLAVTKKVMNVSEQSSQQLIKMLEKSANPDLGNFIDAKV